MKTLLLMRHAKSDRSSGTVDFDRPLNKRGRHAAPQMAALLRDKDLVPDLALVSSSARTRETWELMGSTLGELTPPTELMRELYLAQPEVILHVVKSVPNRTGTLLVLGHNPGLQAAVHLFASGDQDKEGQQALAAVDEKFATAAIACLEFAERPWSETRFGTGRLRWMKKPARP